jgi:hypothetical protein
MPFGVKKQLPGALRFFNLDLHLAVIADIKDTLHKCVLPHECPVCVAAKSKEPVVRSHFFDKRGRAVSAGSTVTRCT